MPFTMALSMLKQPVIVQPAIGLIHPLYNTVMQAGDGSGGYDKGRGGGLGSCRIGGCWLGGGHGGGGRGEGGSGLGRGGEGGGGLGGRCLSKDIGKASN